MTYDNYIQLLLIIISNKKIGYFDASSRYLRNLSTLKVVLLFPSDLINPSNGIVLTLAFLITFYRLVVDYFLICVPSNVLGVVVQVHQIVTQCKQR